MTTALDILKRSLRMLGVVGIGETPSAEETADGLTALNALVGTISNTGLVFAKSLDALGITAGSSSITVGPTGQAVTTRPVKVLEESYLLIGGVSYPLSILTLQQYNDLSSKTETGIPTGMMVQMGSPNVTLTFYPVPSQSATLKLWSDKPLSSTLTAATALSLPPGYEDALAYLLAESIAPEYEMEPPPAVMRGVARSSRLLRRTNFEVPQIAPVWFVGQPSSDLL